MKKYFHKINQIILLLSLLLFMSCEKVIHLDTENVPPKYVIEGNMSDQKGDCIVYITQSVKLNDRTIFPAIGGASVAITEDSGAPVYLEEVNPGIYISDQLHATPGHNYKLQVKIENEQFTANVKAPRKVSFDSLYLEDFEAFGDVRKFAHVVFKDPVGKGDAYRFLQYKNRIQNSNIFVMDDEYSDGRSIDTFLAYFDQSDDQKIQPGDTVKVQMQCIAPSVFKFFYSLSQSSTGGSEVVSPGNPITNISGGALGYFNVFTKEEKTIVAGQ